MRIVRRLGRSLLALALAVCGCQPASSAAPSAAPSAATATPAASVSTAPVLELPAQRVELAAGRYTNGEFAPRITFEVDEGWSAVAKGPGFIEIRRTPEGFDAIALRFIRPVAVYGSRFRPLPATKAAVIAEALHSHEVLDVIGESPSRMSGLEGTVLELEYPGPADAVVAVFDVPGRPDDPLYVAPERRLWVAMFDTGDGVLVILVEGSSSDWESDLRVVEPVLESVTIGQ